MTSGAFPAKPAEDGLVASMRNALGAIEVIGPDRDGQVVLRLLATWGELFQWELGISGQDAEADAWLAWRDLLA